MWAGGSAWLERSADKGAETERSRVQISPGPFLMFLLSFAEYVIAVYLADVFEAGFYELTSFFCGGGNLGNVIVISAFF